MIVHAGYLYEQIDVPDEPWFERTRNTGWYCIDEVHDFPEHAWKALNDLHEPIVAAMARFSPEFRLGKT